MEHTEKYKVRLGLFVIGGLILFLTAIFIIGRQKHLFDPVFNLTTTFSNVSGLQVGNNVRFAGINVGTVDNIQIVNDSTVKVDMLIQQDVKKFIKSDCIVSIGSEGIVGDRLLTISQGSYNAPLAKSGQHMLSNEPVETDRILSSLQITANNTAIISDLMVNIIDNINSGRGTLGRLIRDTAIAENINQTIFHLRESSQGLDENMKAVKESIFLKGYFNKKEKDKEQKEEDKVQKDEDLQEQKTQEENKDNEAK
jgi:phospholipid/cholesterol/gamma-HCH transport system substrate-binding protein